MHLIFIPCQAFDTLFIFLMTIKASTINKENENVDRALLGLRSFCAKEVSSSEPLRSLAHFIVYITSGNANLITFVFSVFRIIRVCLINYINKNTSLMDVPIDICFQVY